MDYADEIKNFYQKHIPGATLEENFLKGPCPLCKVDEDEKPGTIAVQINPESFFLGYFRCASSCTPGGFLLHFGRSMGIDPKEVPGYDPDRDPYVRDIIFPTRNLGPEVLKYINLMSEDKFAYFKEFGVPQHVLKEMKIGYNGRYLVYPYYQENGNCYAARCVLPDKPEDYFWHGDEAFFAEEFRIFNTQEIERCENGTLFITDNEDGLLSLKGLGYPGIAVPSAADLEVLSAERLAYVDNIFLMTSHTPEAHVSARALATRLGFKARIIKWPSYVERGYSLCHLAREKGKGFKKAVSTMIKESKAFSPFSSPEKEQRVFFGTIEREKGKDILGFRTGFEKMDAAHNGIRGINIMGGQPKAGKSCFFMQISTEMARRKVPVIYYDFENGKKKIYSRTLCRLGKLTEKDMREEKLDKEKNKRKKFAYSEFENILKYFRVVTDRKLNPDIMRRHIDFLQHETRNDNALVVVDSLHKLPIKDLSERRTGIDWWLRHMEAIRDEQNVSFLVISELTRSMEGSYKGKPDMGSFKGSGDIEYSADNAMIFLPDWDALDSITNSERKSTLWMVASRENSPGQIATYRLEYPFWGFTELE